VAAPQSVGLPQDVAAPFLDGLARWTATQAVVGAELHIIKNRRTVVHAVAGWADREQDIVLAEDTVFRIRSMTKPFVGTAVLMLAADGKLDLAAPVASYLPSFDHPRSRQVTVELLLRHLGGFDQPGFVAPLERYPNLRAAVDDLGRAGPTAEPGSRFRYSDASSAVLGALVAEVAGSPLEHWIDTRLLAPLGMADTSCRLREDQRDRLCSAYVWRQGQFVKYWDRHDPERLPFFRGSGGMVSTTTDQARFLACWMDAARQGDTLLLGEAWVRGALTVTPQSRGFRGYAGYGQHWVLYSVSDPTDERALLVFGHEGSDGTWAMACPALDLMVLYFTQSRGGDTAFEVMRLVGELVARCELPESLPPES